MKRREFITLLRGAAATWPMVAPAQQAMPVIGFIGSMSSAAVKRHIAAFREVLKENGYEEGKTVAIEYRWAEGEYELLPNLASPMFLT